MPTPLLRTKLYIPPARPNLVPRSRLNRQLNQGLQFGRKLTLVAAPAGFGKTTLLSTWLAEIDRPAAWLALDEHDNDPVRFLAYVIAALQTINDDIGEAVKAMLDGAQPPALDALMTELINEIAAVAEPFVLVLDDYHEIETPAIHDALAFLLDNQPPNMHLVIASRIDPPVPLARLRVRNQLTELRAGAQPTALDASLRKSSGAERREHGDLRFTDEEAAAFLNEAMGLSLSPDDVAALENRTEGWIAGLQLAALSMQGRDDVENFIDAFTGDDRYVLDYLTEEVLTQQPAHVQDFLLRTSILDRLRGSLCDAVMERDDGQAILEQLEETNLFVVPLDNTRTWYRYHTLFADLLRYRLQETVGKDGIAALHVRASEWYEANDFPHEAIDHALSAGAFDRAARLIESVAHRALWERGELRTLLQWVDQVPSDVLQQRRQLLLHYAYALADVARTDDAEAQLALLDDQFETEVPAQVRGQVACVRSSVARLQGDAQQAIELAHEALRLLPTELSYWRGSITLTLGTVHFSSGNVAAAEQALAQALTIEQANESIAIALMTIYVLGRLKLLQADLYAAERVYQDGIQYAKENRRGGRLIPTAGAIYAGLGELHYYWNDLDEAEEYLTTGIELGERIGNLSTLALGHGILARLRHVQGDVDGVQQSLQHLREIRRDLQTQDVEWAGDELAADEMQIEVLLSNHDTTRRWAETFSADTSYMAVNEFMLVSLARVRLAHPQATEKLEQVVSLLTEHIPDAEAARRLHLTLEMLTLKALALYVLGRSDEAVETLARALALAEPSDYVRIFVDEGKPMVDLLTETLKRRRAGTLLAPADYISDLLTEFDAEDLPEPVVQTAHKTPQPLLEPLTERELDVLQLMAEGYTNREIASRLHITVGTVKSHAKNIYGKLDVHSRTQAAARARDLDIL